MMKSITVTWLMVLGLLLSGCTTPHLVGGFVDRICHLGEERRLKVKERIYATIQPHVVVLYCSDEIKSVPKQFPCHGEEDCEYVP